MLTLMIYASYTQRSSLTFLFNSQMFLEFFDIRPSVLLGFVAWEKKGRCAIEVRQRLGFI